MEDILTSEIAITFGTDNIGSYGTDGSTYRLWLDYIYDVFGATLDRKVRRYAVSIGIGLVVFLIGLLIAVPLGLAGEFVITPGFYIVAIGIAWFMGSLRWLSQIYHVRTNQVRPCFPIPDQAYQKLVKQYAARATNNRTIAIGCLLVALVFWTYLAIVYFAPAQARDLLLVGFPQSVPTLWRAGDNLIPKMLIIDIFCTGASVGIYTGAHITLVTLPLFRAYTRFPVIPVPNLVAELFSGLLAVYRTGALMWSFGIVLVELIYGTHLDLVNIAFVICVSILGLLAFFIPRSAVLRIISNSQAAAVLIALQHYYSSRSAKHAHRHIIELDRYIRSVVVAPSTSLTLSQMINLVGGQLLPVVPFFLNAKVLGHLSP